MKLLTIFAALLLGPGLAIAQIDSTTGSNEVVQLTANSPAGPMETVVVTASRSEVLTDWRDEMRDQRRERQMAWFEHRRDVWIQMHSDNEE